ncbi:HesA/MoeB/ThiF family protein [Limosilactobacillus caccae]|uniref:HesA/MoeB/ThiF family protein n=1 Tax=Limosilactobacillus caccae TaxID=1926284 RepID=UPI000970DA10|nr:HesA/MoeB/ThiF family protein [Limosilactobacillus caccae]
MDRYDRQERVQQIGPTGQAKINQATVLIVGVGALGSYAASLLARAGVHRLILVDPDVVSETNLQRQALFTEEDAKKQRLKVLAANQHLQAINSTVEVITIPAPLDENIVKDYQFDLCLDCLDNYQGRDLLNRLAIVHHFDYLFASCAGNYGNVMAISPTDHPCLNCVFPNLKQLMQTDCDLIGVNTALVPIVAGMQASLALHYLVDQAHIDFDHLLTVDNWSMTATKFKIKKDGACQTCQSASIPLDEESEPKLKMLCGEDAYYTNLEGMVSLQKWQAYLSKKKLLRGRSPLFIHFTWQKLPVSLFKNGRLIMYHLANTDQANNQLASITHLAKQIKEEG